MARDTPDTREEPAAKLPTLHVLRAMGYTFVSPGQALTIHGAGTGVLLESVLRARLRQYRFAHRGKSCALSPGGIDEDVRTFSSTGLKRRADQLIPANKAQTSHITKGITVT